MLKIKNLKVNVGEKEILKGVNLDFELGKNYLLLGKNGSGKSSLANFLMGNPNYEYEEGSVKLCHLNEIQNQGECKDTLLFSGLTRESFREQKLSNSNSDLLKSSDDGKILGSSPRMTQKNKEKNLLKLSPDQRSKLGLFLSFQNIPEIEGVKLGEFLRIIYNIHLKNKNPDSRDISPFIFKRYIGKYLEELNIPESFLDRDLNVGFSGGEKRKIEILQMKLIEPKYIILDEIDSGLDVNAFKIIAKTIKEMSNKDNTFIIITHQFKILDYINVDKTFVMEKGKIVEEGGEEVIKKIYEKGFE